MAYSGPSGINFKQVTYVGDGSNSRLLTIGFSPKLIFILDTGAGAGIGIVPDSITPTTARIWLENAGNTAVAIAAALPGTGVDVGVIHAAGIISPDPNINAHNYQLTAYG